MHSVTYKEIFEDGKETETTMACFSYIREAGKLPKTIEYYCAIDKATNVEQVKFFIDFLSKILDSARFTYSIDKEGKICTYKLNCVGLSNYQCLLYLTAMRYPDDFPEIVSYFHTNYKNVTNVNELFKNFQIIHGEYFGTKFPIKKNGNMSGHGLMYNYYWLKPGYKFEPMTLEDFKKNCKLTLRGVHNYFNKQA